MTEKTIAMRVLDGKRITYEVLSYPADMGDAEEIARYLNLPAAVVFKTLVVLPPEVGKKPMLVMLPADAQLDLKRLAAAVGAKKLKMATHREAEELTGLQVGGISAVALLNKGFAVYIDVAGQQSPTICISAGKKGLQLRIAVKELIKLVNARVVDVSAHERREE
jgi:Cys-tRNA(Pro)/Cys-tRNA(Cys) deacylase